MKVRGIPWSAYIKSLISCMLSASDLRSPHPLQQVCNAVAGGSGHSGLPSPARDVAVQIFDLRPAALHHVLKHRRSTRSELFGALGELGLEVFQGAVLGDSRYC